MTETNPSPVVSVVVLNYNYARYLPGCLESILGQTFTDFELIVIDDCSKDDSREVIERFARRDARVRPALHQVNSGFAKSLIEGTEELSRGEFLMVVSADDLVSRPNAFATQVELLRRYPKAAFCFSAIQLIGPNESGIDSCYESELALEPAAALRAIFEQKARPAHSGTMIRKSSYQACGGYRRDLKMALDLAMWVSLAIEGGFAYSPEPLSGYRLHEGQMSAALAGIRRNAGEVRSILRDAYREGVRRGYDIGASERDVFVMHFEACAIHEAFHRGRRLAAYRVLATALESPIGALTSRKMWLSALRTLLGEAGFGVLRSALTRIPAFRNS